MTSIKIKLLSVIIVGIILLSCVFYIVSVQTQDANLRKITLDGIMKSKNTFENLQQDDVKMLKMGINNFLANKDARQLFLSGERDTLIKTLQPTFNKSKALGQSVYQINIYEPNNTANLTVFARVHNPLKFGDPVTRTANRVARETKDWGYGIDLGNSGFALRVVSPLSDNSGNIVGDVEFGEELNHFLGLMKNQTGNNYVMVVDKSKVKPDQWKIYTDSKGIRNNYDDLQNYLVIDSTINDTRAIQATSFNENDLGNVPPEGRIFSKFTSDGKTFVSGGFSFNDINNNKIGTVVVIEDVTTLENNAKQNNMTLLIVAILAAIIVGGVMVFLVTKIVIEPLEKIVNVSTRVAGGDFEATIDYKSDDEIGQLAETMEQFKQMMVNTAKDLEEAQKKK